MTRDSEAVPFWLTAASAAASLLSIAAMEILLGAAFLVWLFKRPIPAKLPSFWLPLVAFFTATAISYAMSPDPAVGWHPIQKFVLFPMILLATVFVTTEARARSAYRLLLLAGTVSGVIAIIQFPLKQLAFMRSGDIADDPTLLDRVTGPLSHWTTFSGVEMLVWCAGIPALLVLGRRWIAASAIIGLAIVLSNTRGAWLGAAAGFLFTSPALPRRALIGVLAAAVLAGTITSPFIYRRIMMSLDSSLATNYSREVYFRVGTQMIQDHPLFGVGPERIHDEFPRYYAKGDIQFYGHLHNNFVQIGAERGLICLATFLWFVVELYRSLIQLLKTGPESARWVTLGALAAFTAFIVAGMMEFNLGDSEVLVLLLFIISIPFGLSLQHVQEDPDRQPG